MRATTWVLYEVTPERADVYTKLLLLVIADQADDEGRNAICSRRYLSEVTGFGETTVADRLRRAQADGLLAPGDPRITEFLPPNRRSGVWDLPISRQWATRARPTTVRGRHAGPEHITELRQATRRGRPSA